MSRTYTHPRNPRELFVKERLGLEASKTREWQCREHCSSRSWWCMEHHSPPVTSEGGGHHLTFNTVVNSQLSWEIPVLKAQQDTEWQAQWAAASPLVGVIPAWFCEGLHWGPHFCQDHSLYSEVLCQFLFLSMLLSLSLKQSSRKCQSRLIFLTSPEFLFSYFPCTAFDVISPSVPWQFHTYSFARVHTLIKLKEQEKAKYFFL